ncbi:hypothetical protein HIJ84_21285 [Cronobacter sakazakii]|nr:hypothetical protein [Cronobacter sakazakii]
MSYTPMSDLGQQGLFDITRTLMRQPDLCALAEALSSDFSASASAQRSGWRIRVRVMSNSPCWP